MDDKLPKILFSPWRIFYTSPLYEWRLLSSIMWGSVLMSVSAIRYQVCCASAIILIGSLLSPHHAWGQATPVAGYSPGARSATTANTMLDSVVGNAHSPLKKQTSITGDLYHIAADGTVTAPNGLIVPPGGCQTPSTTRLPTGQAASAPNSHYQFGTGRRGKGFETVTIGVSEQPILATSSPHPPTTRRATLNASFGPTGIYILPEPCTRSHPSDRALTLDAATSLASADGNAFTLAGNRSHEIPVNTAQRLPDGDIGLSNNALAGPTSP